LIFSEKMLKCTKYYLKCTIMTTITATELKQSFWTRLQEVKNNSFTITKRNRKYAVLMDYEEYSYLKQLEEHEDILFWLAAQKILKDDNMASKQETNNLLDSID